MECYTLTQVVLWVVFYNQKFLLPLVAAVVQDMLILQLEKPVTDQEAQVILT